MEKGNVYMITSPSGRIYVGSSKNIKRRICHYRNLSPQIKSQIKLYRSFLKYGFNSHDIEIIWEGDVKDMLKYEYMIGTFYEVLDKDKGLNLKLPKWGTDYYCVGEETRKRMSISAIGRRHTQESKLKMSKVKSGYSHTEESKALMSKTKKSLNLTGEKSARFGLKLSPELIEKQILAQKEFWKNNQDLKKRLSSLICKKVLKFDLSGNLLEEYDSLRDACTKNNVKNNSGISKACSTGKTHKKHIWKWKDSV